MDPASFFRILTNSTLMVTQLMGRDPVHFTHPHYNVAVREDHRPGPLLTLQATTQPAGGEVTYSLLGWQHHFWFAVHPRTGALTLLEPLDYERQPLYRLSVVARSSAGAAAASVLIEVKDVNEFAPAFLSDHYQTQITEEDDRHLPKQVLQVPARDRDAGRWGELRYTLSGDGVPASQEQKEDEEPGISNDYERGSNEFPSPSLSPSSPSQKFHKSSFHNQNKNKFSPTISFWSATKDGEPASLSLKKTVGQWSGEIQSSSLTAGSLLNDKMPEFWSSGSVENEKDLKFLGSSYQTLPTPVAPPSVSKSRHWQNEKPSFSIDENTGTIFVLKPLDRDAPLGRPRWLLRVSVTDGELTAETPVVVNLKDVNDNAPTFPVAHVTASVRENAPSGTAVITVTAEDADDYNEASNARLHYSLQKNVIDERTGLAMFTVDRTTGQIRTALCCLDREHTASYGLVMAASDGGGLQGTCTITVNIEDENDVPPQFVRSQVSVSVPEAFSAAYAVSAVSGVSNVSGASNVSGVSNVSGASNVSTVSAAAADVPKVSDTTLLRPQFLTTLAVRDADTSNVFAYRVVPNSGNGWQLVEVTAGAAGGDVFARVPLDFENPHHREGLHFTVQVTDQGALAWSSLPRVSECSVAVTVQDVNDNPPVFDPGTVDQTVALREDVEAGTLVGTVTAFDLDSGAGGLITYSLAPSNSFERLFMVDTSEGTVTVRGAMDRETVSLHRILVLATDSGQPPLTATATITMTVQDVNDNPPHIDGSSVVRLPLFGGNSENTLDNEVTVGTSVPFTLTLDDPDDWSLGHGPPFVVTPILRDSPQLAGVVQLKFSEGIVSPSGRMTVSGEVHILQLVSSALTVPLKLTDAGTPPQSALTTLTLLPPGGTIHRTTADRMAATANALSARTIRKEVTAVTVGSPTTAVPLGLVSTASSPEPSHIGTGNRYRWTEAAAGLRLDPRTGQLSLVATATPGRHAGRLRVLGSPGGAAVDVSIVVDVLSISADTLLTATPILLTADPHRLLKPMVSPNNVKDGRSPLDALVHLLNSVISGTGDASSVSLQSLLDVSPTAAGGVTGTLVAVAIEQVPSSTSVHSKVWLLNRGVEEDSEEGDRGLEMVILRYKTLIESLLSANVSSVGVSAVGGCASGRTVCRCCCKDTTMLGQSWQVLDTAQRTHVGPEIKIKSTCKCPRTDYSSQDALMEVVVHDREEKGNLASLTSAHAITSLIKHVCSHNTCLNGGKCVPDEYGKPRCICPGHTFGPRCKVLTRHFGGHPNFENEKTDSLEKHFSVWLPAFPSCSRVHASLYVLTRHGDGTIFSTETNQGKGYRYLALHISNGYPHLLIRKGPSLVATFVTLGKNVADNKWHRLDLLWINETLTLIVDRCLDTGMDPLASSSQTSASLPIAPESCIATMPFSIPDGPLGWGTPIEMGGRVVTTPELLQSSLTSSTFQGCISHFRVNRKFHDFGNTLNDSYGSSPGCPFVKCFKRIKFCSSNSRCFGSPGSEQCECGPGHDGPDCQERASALYFLDQSYINLELSFTPPEHWAAIEFSVRTRSGSGLLLLLRSRHNRDWLGVELEAGNACLVVVLGGRVRHQLCTKQRLDDGSWHHVTALRHGSFLEISCNHGEEDLYASSVMPDLQGLPFSVSRRRGVLLGGVPVGETNGDDSTDDGVVVNNDFHHGCLSDIRLFGQRLLLPTSIDSGSNKWSVPAGVRVLAGCTPPGACANTTCISSLSCGHNWGLNTCGCPPGLHLSRDLSSCLDVDECRHNPCLQGGTCVNTQPGYRCECGTGQRGQNCQWGAAPPFAPQPPTLLLPTCIAAAMTLMALIAFLFWFGTWRRRRCKRVNKPSSSSTNISSSSVSQYDCRMPQGHDTTVEDVSLPPSCPNAPMSRHSGAVVTISPSALLHVGQSDYRSNFDPRTVDQVPLTVLKGTDIGTNCTNSDVGSCITSDIAIGTNDDVDHTGAMLQHKFSQLSIVGLDLANLPPPPDDESELGEVCPIALHLIPPPSSLPHTGFGFDGGGNC